MIARSRPPLRRVLVGGALLAALLPGAALHAQAPGEVPGFQWCLGTVEPDCLLWTAVPGASEYRLYRGSADTLTGLLDGSPDSCRVGRFFTPTTGSTPLLTPAPAVGELHWFLATAVGTGGEGPAGTGDLGPLVVDAVPCAVSPAGLAGAWPFGEGVGSATADASPFGNDGELFGPSWTGSGRYGNGLIFDGVGDSVRVPNSPTLDIAGTALTVAMWINPVDTGNDAALLAKPWNASSMTAPYYQYAVEFDANSDNSIDFYFGDTTATLRGPYPLTVPIGSWTHVAWVYDGVQVRGYVNGIQQIAVPAVTAIQARGQSLRMGVDGAFQQALSGQLDEVQIYARALAPQEIQNLMEIPLTPGIVPDPPELVITAPSPAATVVGTTLPITWTMTGDLSEVDHVRFRIDGGPERQGEAADGAYSWTGLRVGAHTLTCYLLRGDQTKIFGSDAAPVSFSNVADPSDPNPPSVSLTAPGDGASLEDVVGVTANAADDIGVLGVQFLLDGADLGTEDMVAPYGLDWDTLGVANGPHTLTARARDVAGNETVSAAVDVTVANSGSTDPSVIGQWGPVIELPLVTVHGALLRTGKLLLWDDHTTDPGVQVWDPINGTTTAVPYPARNLFCSAHTGLPDGRIMVVGGQDGSPYVGLRDATFFDPISESWSAGPLMTYGRWYPTALALPDGRVLVVSGSIDCEDCNDPNGTHDGIALIPEIYDPTTNSWSSISTASLSLPLYPHLYGLSDGRVVAVANQEDPVRTYVLDLVTGTWSTVSNTLLDAGSSAMYLPDRIVKSGSARNPDYPPANSAPTTYDLDMAAQTAAWDTTAPMAFARTQHTLTLLPDGTVLATGGAGDSNVYSQAQAVLNAELWNPQTRTWRTLAAMVTPRQYHSIAILLPDGRVWISGGGRFGIDEFSAEIFSPPYLFKGARPVISSAPATLAYGGTFTIQSPNAAAVDKVVLMRPASVTHAINMNQMYVPLTFSEVGGALEAQAPADANLAPPGWWMLFVLTDQGVPSLARWVHIPVPTP